MKATIKTAFRVGACAFVSLFGACTANSPRVAEWHRQRVESSNQGLSDWANVSNNMITEKYGPPDRVETVRLVWENRGPWKKIMVWDELGFTEKRDSNNLEETISYVVPADKRADLTAFSRGLTVSPDGTELSARSGSEDRNFLMLNLADEIVHGQLSPEDARGEYLHAIQLSEAGKSSPAMQGLLFK